MLSLPVNERMPDHVLLWIRRRINPLGDERANVPPAKHNRVNRSLLSRRIHVAVLVGIASPPALTHIPSHLDNCFLDLRAGDPSFWIKIIERGKQWRRAASWWHPLPTLDHAADIDSSA